MSGGYGSDDGAPRMLFSSILHYRGLIAASGSLEITTERLRFTPSGWLDRITGAGQTWELPLLSIGRATLQGRIDRRLVIGAGGEEQVLGGGHLEECLAAVIEHHMAAESQWGEARRELRGMSLLERWASVLGLDSTHLPEVPACELGMLQGPWRGAHFGWLLVLDGLRFLPIGRARETPDAWQLEAGDLEQPAYDEERQLTLPGDRVFFPSQGDAGLRRLRSAWRNLRTWGPVPAGYTTRRATYRSRPTVPPAAVLRVLEPADALPPPAERDPGEDTLPDPPVDSAPVPDPYSLDDPSLAGVAPEVPVGLSVVERRVHGELRDLSGGGARVAVSEAVEPGDEVFLEVPGLIPGKAFHAFAIHAREVAGPHVNGRYWLVGLRFDGLLPPEQNLIDKLVMLFQRAELAEMAPRLKDPDEK